MTDATQTSRAAPLIIARISTRNFSFEGAGHDKASALAALREGLAVHGSQCGLAPDWLESAYSINDVAEFQTYQAGGAWRDRDALPLPKGGAA